MTLIPEQNQAPLADRMRPRTLDEFIGQRHIVGPGKLLRRAIEADRLTSSHLLRAARLRQDHAGFHHCPGNHRAAFVQAERRNQRRGAMSARC